MTLPPVILAVLACFESAFTTPTFEKAGWLVVGTLLARGRRTVAATLRYLGWQDQSNFNKYHDTVAQFLKPGWPKRQSGKRAFWLVPDRLATLSLALNPEPPP